MNPRPNAVLCVGAVVLCERDVLLVRQADGHPLAGRWTIPWGFVDPGEPPASAALRETVEEAGVIAEVEGLLGMQVLPYGGDVGLVFLCRYVSGEPQRDGREVDAVGWFDAAGFERVGDSIEPWCAWVVRRVLAGEHRTIPLAAGHPYGDCEGFL